MKQFWLQVTALIAIIFAGFWVTVNRGSLNGVIPNSTNGVGATGSSRSLTDTNTTNGYAINTITINSSSGQIKTALSVEIADSDQKRALGLGERNSLGQNSGMLFLFPSAKIPQFWMKGMRFSLDMVWINGDTVVGAQENAPAPSGTPGEVLPIYSPTQAIDKVLEVNAGFVKQHGILAGDKLEQVQ